VHIRELKDLPWKLFWSLIPERYYMEKQGIDSKGFYKIKEKYQGSESKIKGLKYLRFNVRFRGRLRYALKLGLNNSSPKKILDIGTGVGYFPYICNRYGHDGHAMDLGDFPVFNELIQLLDVDRMDYCVKPFEQLPAVVGKYDLITAFLICFNNHNQNDLWGVKEWDFFLKDLAKNQLNPQGKVFFHFNYEKKTGKPFDLKIADFFIQHRAKIHKNEVTFESMSSFRSS
jgi:hypothetical protein